MSEFFVGQKIVCIDAGPSRNRFFPEVHLISGAIYTIRALVMTKWGLGVFTVETPSTNPSGYHSTRFRPLESKAVSLFRQIARDVTEGKKVRIGA